MIVRELTGGVYFGEPKQIIDLGNGQKRAIDTQVYDTYEIERIGRVAFDLARKRRNKVTSAEKRNVMKSGVLWNEVMTAVHKREYRRRQLEHQLADALGMQLVRWPKQFDVIVTDNLFGDMLSDVAAMLTGSLGMLPSASLGDVDPKTGKRKALYEPVHGSAPDIAGKGLANPIAMIGSLRHGAALFLRPGRGGRPARGGDRGGALAEGLRTADIRGEGAGDRFDERDGRRDRRRARAGLVADRARRRKRLSLKVPGRAARRTGRSLEDVRRTPPASRLPVADEPGRLRRRASPRPRPRPHWAQTIPDSPTASERENAQSEAVADLARRRQRHRRPIPHCRARPARSCGAFIREIEDSRSAACLAAITKRPASAPLATLVAATSRYQSAFGSRIAERQDVQPVPDIAGEIGAMAGRFLEALRGEDEQRRQVGRDEDRGRRPGIYARRGFPLAPDGASAWRPIAVHDDDDESRRRAPPPKRRGS